jgi:cell division protein FtsB
MVLKDKKKLIVKLTELMLYCGYDITDLIFKPSTYYDYDKVKVSIAKYTKEKKQIDGKG